MQLKPMKGKLDRLSDKPVDSLGQLLGLEADLPVEIDGGSLGTVVFKSLLDKGFDPSLLCHY